MLPDTVACLFDFREWWPGTYTQRHGAWRPTIGAQGTPAENKAAMERGIALFGTYGPDKGITMKVEGSTYPNWTGTDQKRAVVSFTGDELKWTLPASIGETAEVTWKRIK